MAFNAPRAAVLCTAGLALVAALPAQEEMTFALWLDGTGTSLSHGVVIEDTVEDAQAGGFNTLIALVRGQGATHWRSDIEPLAENVHGALGDPLATLLSRARHPEEGEPLEVWAAANVMLVHRGATLPPPGHIMQSHRDWLLPTAGGEPAVREEGVLHTFIDPVVEEAREHTVDVIRELASNHDAAALVLDMLRMPATDEPLGVGPIAMMNWNEETGSVIAPTPNDPQAKNWRRRAITQLLREIVEGVRLDRPEMPIWIAVETTGDLGRGFEETPVYRQMLQDWPRWLEQGLADGVILKSRHNLRTEEGLSALQSWLSFARGIAGDAPVIVSLSGEENYQSPLFNTMAELRAADDPVAGIALWHHSDPARDATAAFYTNLERAVFEERGRFQFEVPGRSVSAPRESDAVAELASIEMPMLDTTALDAALGMAPTGEMTADAAAMAPSPEEALPMPPMPPEEFAPMETSPQAAMEPAEEEMAMPSEVEEMTLPSVEEIAEMLPPPVAPELIEGTLTPIEDGDSDLATEGPGVFDDLEPAAIPAPNISTLLTPTTQDLVTLHSGRRIEGEISDEFGDRIIITLPSGSTVTIPKDQIQSIDHAAD